ncbi:TPA: PTS mannose/fructose/sorbose transporter subunit IIB, partial [bacterium]|nr:PTS mannose/fructose/sorbose transporter subunit IIB [bacterium]
MSISLVRIDDKLIHAQITWGWVPLIRPTHLIVVNDEAEKDQLRKEILLMAGE